MILQFGRIVRVNVHVAKESVAGVRPKCGQRLHLERPTIR